MKFWESERSPPVFRPPERFAKQNLDAGGIHFPRADKKRVPKTGFPVLGCGRSILLSDWRI